MSYRPYLEPGALRQMHGLPEQALDLLVALLARICDSAPSPHHNMRDRKGQFRAVAGCRPGARLLRRSSAGDPDRDPRSVVAMPLADPAGQAWFDVAGASAPNDEVADQARSADDDVITAGREPAGWPGWPGSLIWLLIIAETAALAGTAALALHYRTEVSKLRHGTPAAAGRPAAPPLPQLTSVALRLPAGGNVTGTVLITAAITPGAVRAQFTVSAGIAGGRPGVVYDLSGNDCSAIAPLPDHVWATGLTSADGRAELTGYAWTGAVTDEYWLTLSPSPGSPPPGLHGRFADGTAAPFPGGQAPCADLP